MTIRADLDALAAALHAFPGMENSAATDLAPILPARGAIHDHLRIAGSGRVLRVPRLVQAEIAPADALACQAACFKRASASGHVPRLHGIVAPAPGIPLGALLIDDIVGPLPRLPEDLEKIAATLAKIHALPVAPPAARAPLPDHTDPVAGTLAIIERQAGYFAAADIDANVRAALAEDLAWAREFARDAATKRQPVTLVGSDTHPGNFLIGPDRRAYFVDLERALYGSPAIDLAHATIYTSTTWPIEIQISLSADATRRFYDHYLGQIGAQAATALRPWLAPMRRLTWLRSMSWFARWRVESAKPRPATPGERKDGGTSDWSREDSDPALADHISRRVGAFFDSDIVATIRAEWTDDARAGLFL